MTIDWNHFTPWASLVGGILLGLASALFILVNGRILGISGILGGLLSPRVGDALWRMAFLLGLFAAPPTFMALAPAGLVPAPRIEAGTALVGRKRKRRFEANGRLDLVVTNFGGEPNSLYLGGDRAFKSGGRRMGIHGPSLPVLGFGADFLDQAGRALDEPLGETVQLLGGPADAVARAHEPGAVAHIEREARAGDLHAALEVDRLVEPGDVPVRLGRRGDELRVVTPLEDDLVVGLGAAFGHRIVGDIGDGKGDGLHLLLDLGDLLLELLHLGGRERLHQRQAEGAVLAEGSPAAGIGLPPADDPTVPDPFLDCECGRRWAFDTRGWHAIAPTQPASAEQATVQPTTLQNAIAWGRLYDRAQALCAEIGYAGSVSTDDDEVELLMDALHAIDGGEWMPGLLPAVAAPAPSAERQPVANRDTPALHEAARMALDALVALVPRVKHDATAREKAGRAIDALRAAIGEGEGN